MKILKLPEMMMRVLPAMNLRDAFILNETDVHTCVYILRLHRGGTSVRVLEFKSTQGKRYRCNVWDNRDVFYVQEIES